VHCQTTDRNRLLVPKSETALFFELLNYTCPALATKLTQNILIKIAALAATKG
jgi:hypothetical protein